MTREDIQNQPAQLVHINNGKSTVIKEGTRNECWNAKAQTVGRYNLNEGNVVVTLKSKKSWK